MTYGYSSDPEVDRSTTRVMTWAVILTIALAAAFPLYLLYEPSSREDARAAQLASLASEGGSIWEFNCAACHGVSGEGGSAPALNAKEFLQSADNDQIELLIAVGIPGTAMSAYSQDFAGPMTSSQIQAVATYIRSWEQDAPSNPNWRLGAAAPAEDETAAEVYASTCASCHGSDLAGGTGPSLDGSSDSVEDPDSLLFRRIADGRGAMPAFSSRLSDDQINDLVGFIRSEQGS